MTADTTLAHIIDGLMYEMPVDKQTVWKERFRDFRDLRHIFLSQVATRLIISALRDCRPNARPDGQAAIDLVIALYQRQLAGDEPAQAEWDAAEMATRPTHWVSESALPIESAALWARSAAHSAAQFASSRESADWLARELEQLVWAAAESSAWAAAESAALAERSSAMLAARSAAYSRYADELVRLLEEAA